jgi:hypothetical protein
MSGENSPRERHNKRMNGPESPAGPPASLMAALERIFAPVVRLALAHGLTLPVMVEQLKRVYVKVATRHFSLASRPITNSRISLLTGVHRKDVRRLVDEERAPTRLPTVTVGTALVARWLADDDYQDGYGRPRRLALRGTKASFETLVALVSGQDLRGRVVLDELMRLGVVELDGDGVILCTDGFVPREGFDEKADYFGNNVRDHVAAAGHNLEDQRPALLERAVGYHGLSVEDIVELQAVAEQDASALLRKLNRRALAMKTHNKTLETPGCELKRMNFGVYFLAADDDGDDG